MKKVLDNTMLLLILLAIIIIALLIYAKKNDIKYNKAICTINGEEVEIKIKDVKKLEYEEYTVTDDKDFKWILSSRYCVFVEE